MNVPNIIETVNITHEIAWQPWAVSYFFFVAIALGAALTSLMWTLLHRPGWQGAGRIAILVMISAAIVSPVALLADLHQPGRFWHFYTSFTPWSWMSWGAFFLPAFVGLALVYGWLTLRPDLPEWAQLGSRDFSALIVPLALVVATLALLVALYSGSEVMVVKSRPLWNSYTLLGFYFFSGVAASAGLGLLVNAILAENGIDERRAASAALGRVMALFSLLTLLTGTLWLLMGIRGGASPEARAFEVIAASPHWQLVGWWLLASFGLSAIFGIYARHVQLGALLGLVTLSGAWLLRWAVFINGQLIPKTGAGFYDYSLPMGPDGALGIAGVFGLWLAVVIVTTSLVRWQSADPAQNTIPAE